MQMFQSSRDSYEVLRPLGAGGMGNAFLVRSQKTGEQYCIKQLRLDRAGDWKAVELFEREAKVLAQLRHPNIPAYVDYFQEGTNFVLVQAFIDGETLQQRIDQRKPIAQQEFVSYLKQSLEILSYLHALIPPVVHRDITPRNLIVSGDKLYLVDFGSVKVALGPSTSMTSVGTFGYMAPEHLVGQSEPASDLYSLGMSLISLASMTDPSRMPLDKTTGRVDVPSLVSFLPSHLRALLQDMVRPGIAERVPSAKSALERLINPAPTLQVQYSDQLAATAKAHPSEKKADGGKRRFRTLGIISAVLVTLLTLGWASTLLAARGEVRTLGGWFTGHSHLVSAITGTLTGDYSLISSRAWIKGVAYSSNGKIASAGDNQILLWDASSGSVLKTFMVEGFQVEQLSFTPDGKWLAAANEQKVYLFDTESEQGPIVFDLEVVVYQNLKADYLTIIGFVALSKDKILIAYSYKGQTLIVDAVARAVVATLTHPEVYLSHPAAFSADGRGFALAADNDLLYWQLSEPVTQGTMPVKWTLKSPQKLEAVALNKDATLLVGLSEIGGTIWDLASGTTRQDFPARLEGYSFDPYPIEFSADSKLLAIGHDQTLYFFNVESGARLERYDAHRDEIQSLAFSPDGATVVTAASDQLLKIWRAPALK